MHTLQKTNGATGWYHECATDGCRRYYAENGNSPSPGWCSDVKQDRCPRCEHKVSLQVDVSRPEEYRIVRQGDGLTLERFPATENGLERAKAILKRLGGPA